MAEARTCIFCSAPASYYQSVVGTHKDSEKETGIVQTRIFACEECKNEMQRAAGSIRKRNHVFLGAWALQLACTVVIAPFLVPLTLPISLLLLVLTIALANWIFAPKIFKSASRLVAEAGTGSKVDFGDLGEKWRAVDSEAPEAGCSRCRSTSLTHQFEIVGMRHTKTEGTVHKTDVYATVRYKVPLCIECADSLERCLDSARLLRIAGASLIVGLIVYSTGNYFGVQWGAWATWADMDLRAPLILVPIIAFLFMIALAITRVITIYTLENPWLNKTDAFQQLSAEGFDGGVTIGGRPLREPNCRFEIKRGPEEGPR